MAAQDGDSDLFGKLDAELNSQVGEKDAEADTRIQKHVRFLLDGTKPPATEGLYRFFLFVDENFDDWNSGSTRITKSLRDPNRKTGSL